MGFGFRVLGFGFWERRTAPIEESECSLKSFMPEGMVFHKVSLDPSCSNYPTKNRMCSPFCTLLLFPETLNPKPQTLKPFKVATLFVVLYCNFGSLAFLGLLGFLIRQLKVYFFTIKCSQALEARFSREKFMEESLRDLRVPLAE